MGYSTDTRKRTTRASKIWALAALVFAACTSGDMVANSESYDTSESLDTFGQVLAPGVHARLLPGQYTGRQQAVELILDARDIDFSSYQGVVELSDRSLRLLSISVPDTDTHLFNQEGESDGVPIVGFAADGFDEPVSITLNIATPRALKSGDLTVHFDVVANSDGAEIPTTQFYGDNELGEVTYAIAENTGELAVDPANDSSFEGPGTSFAETTPDPSLNVIEVSLGDARKLVLSPNDTVTVPLVVDMSNTSSLNIASLQFRLNWNSDVLSAISYDAGTFGSIEANTEGIDRGEFQANLLSTSGNRSSFTAVTFTMAASDAGTTIPRIEVTAAGNEDGTNILARVASNSVAMCIDAGGLLGDVTGGDLADVIDTQQIARWLVGLEVEYSKKMISHGDVTNDGQTNIVDAQQIARYAVQLPVDYYIGDTITLDCAEALSVKTTKVPDAGVGAEYSFELEATGGKGDLEWFTEGEGPRGLWVDMEGGKGYLRGYPEASAAGDQSITVAVGAGRDTPSEQRAKRPLSITVHPELVVTDSVLLAALIDSAYVTTLNATGGDGNLTWALKDSTLPPGLVLSGDTIRGTPTQTNKNRFRIEATSGVGQKVEKELWLLVSGPLALVTDSLPVAALGKEYETEEWQDENTPDHEKGLQLLASGGDLSYTWSITDGTLPAGLEMKNDTLPWCISSGDPNPPPECYHTKIRGTPTTAGTSTITFQVEDGEGTKVSKELTLTVARIATSVEIQLASDTTKSTAKEYIDIRISSLNDTVPLIVKVKDANGVIPDAPVTWYSEDTTVVKVTSSGQLISVGEGWVKVTATAGANAPDPLGDRAVRPDGYIDPIAAFLQVNVGQEAASVAFADSVFTLTAINDSLLLTAVVKDSSGTVIANRNVWWDNEDWNVASIEASGSGSDQVHYVIARQPGTATVTGITNGMGGDVKGTTKIKVQQIAATLTMSTDSLDFTSFGDTTTVTATGVDRRGHDIVSPTFVWSSSATNVATVSAAGLVTSVADGSATLTAVSDSITRVVAVEVGQRASIISMSDTLLTYTSVSGTAQLSAVVKDQAGTVMGSAPVTWASSDTTVATVSSTGLVTVKGSGAASVTATSETAVGSTAVSVYYNFASVSAGNEHSTAISTTGKLYAWGANRSGQIGIAAGASDEANRRRSPEVVTGGLTWASVSGGAFHSVGITTGGDAYTWGLRKGSNIGGFNDRYTPTLVPGGIKWASISAGKEEYAAHNVGITTDGDAYAWGEENMGKLGDGTYTTTTTPVLVSGGLKWSAISAGMNHTAGITTAGAAYTWGGNEKGQLGDGTDQSVGVPQLVPGGRTWASISAGTEITVGITTDGDAYAWGNNRYGQLGNGTTTTTGTPTLIPGGLTWASISVGEYHVAGVTTAGVAYAWGWNGSGNVGNGTNTTSASPAQVSGGYTWASVAVGKYHTVGVTTSGAAYAWGNSSDGQTGNGTLENSNEPVLIIPRVIVY